MHGVDFNKTFFSIVRRKSLGIFLAIICLFNFIVKQIDIIRAYLKRLPNDNNLLIFMRLPSGIETFRSIQVGLISQLLHSIYVLRQFGRLWNQKVMAFLKSLGFELFNADTSILIHHRKESNNITIISVYVDNFLLVSKYCKSLD